MVTTRGSRGAVLLAVLSIASVQARGGGTDEWRNISPAAGPVNAIAIDPRVPATIYVGTDQAGAFKSLDGGATWAPINNGLPGSRVWQVAVDPEIPSTLYAIVPGSGIFKSLDAGSSWSPVQDGIPSSARSALLALAIDPQSPTTLYAGANGDSLFKTTDGGMTWVRCAPINVQALAIDPRVPTTVYAGTDLNLFKSIDAGASWTQLHTGLRATWVSTIAIDPNTPSTVFVGTRTFETSPPYHRLLKSSDGGATWADSDTGFSGGVIRAVVADPAHRSTLYAGHSEAGVFHSGDAGVRWDPMNDGLPDLRVNTLAFEVSQPALYVGTPAGIFVHRLSPPQFTLSTAKAGIGRGTVTSNPSGIKCGSDCIEAYPADTAVTLSATPALGSLFTGWSGCDTVSGNQCTVVMVRNRSVSASFLGLPLGISR